MAVFRVEKSKDYTVMSNHHLRNPALSLKAKGLLSQMLSLPEGWDYTLAGLAQINKESKDAIRSAVNELEAAGYIHRRQTTDENGKFAANEYIIHEQPFDAAPLSENPTTDNPSTEKPSSENPTQLNKDISSKDISKRKNKKEKPQELPPEEMQGMFELWLRKVGERWPAQIKNQIYAALIAFYSPRAIKNNGSPPVRTERGIHGLCNKLLRDSGGNPNVILDALEDAITAGWTTAHPKKRSGAKSTAPQQRGRVYEEV